MMLFRVLVHAFHSRANVAIYASFSTFFLDVWSLCAFFTTITIHYIRVFPCGHYIFFSEVSSVVRERLLHRSVHGLDMYRRLASMPSSVAMSGALSCDNGFALGDAIRESFVRRTCMLFHLTEDFWAR
jgi:hypothetical protein